MGSFTHMVRLYFLYLFSFSIRKKISICLPKASSNMVVLFQVSLLFPPCHRLWTHLKRSICHDVLWLFINVLFLHETVCHDVRAWSAQRGACHKKHPRDTCVHVVDLWLHGQPFGFWRTAETFQYNNRKKNLISSQYLFFLASSQVNYTRLILDGSSYYSRLQVCSLSWRTETVIGQDKDFGIPAVTHILISLASHRRTWQKVHYWTFKLYIYV